MAEIRHYAYIPETTLLSEEFQKLRPHTKLLYIYMLCRRAGRDKPFTYSYREIRRDTGFKLNTISGCIKKLAEAGFIEYEHGGLEVNYNVYYMKPDWLEW